MSCRCSCGGCGRCGRGCSCRGAGRCTAGGGRFLGGSCGAARRCGAGRIGRSRRRWQLLTRTAARGLEVARHQDIAVQQLACRYAGRSTEATRIIAGFHQGASDHCRRIERIVFASPSTSAAAVEVIARYGDFLAGILRRPGCNAVTLDARGAGFAVVFTVGPGLSVA